MQARLQRARQRNNRHMRAVRARLAELGVRCDCPAIIPRHVWAMAREILADSTGKAARVWLARLARRFPAAVGAIRCAALEPLEDGTCRYTLGDNEVLPRRRVALGLALLELGLRSRRRDKWRLLVLGIARGALLALLANPENGERPGLSTLSGLKGDFKALRRSGFMYRYQMKAHERRDRSELGWPSGRSPNRYYLITRASFHLSRGAMLELLQLEELGYRAGDERPELAPPPPRRRLYERRARPPPPH